MLVFFVGNAKASRNRVFVIGPKQEAVECVNLWGSGNASGVLSATLGPIEDSEGINVKEYQMVLRSLSVGSGRIDFFIRDPEGAIVQEFLNVSTTPFSFTANETGNYSLCMDNLGASNVTVELDYGIELIFYGTSTINFGTSASMSTQIAPTVFHQPPSDGEDDDGSSYVVEPYFNIQGASSMLRVIEDSILFLPLGMVLVGVVGFAVCGYGRSSNLGKQPSLCAIVEMK